MLVLWVDRIGEKGASFRTDWATDTCSEMHATSDLVTGVLRYMNFPSNVAQSRLQALEGNVIVQQIHNPERALYPE